MTQAIIYVRYSPRPDAEECTSNVYQRQRCRTYCTVKQYNVAHVFEDVAVSGGTIDRPQLQAALAALTPDSVLVCDTSDRLARDMMVYLTIQLRVREAGARIEFADGTPPSTTPEGELVSNIFAAFAQYQRSVVQRRTKTGLARKKAGGVYLGTCPIGYCRTPGGSLVEDAAEMKLVRYIMWAHARGASVATIKDFMEEQDDRKTVRGKPWNKRTIRRIIKRGIAKESA